MSKFTTEDALHEVERALKQYHEKLEDNIKELVKAGEACDAAMGSDDLCQHYIGEMDKTIKFLEGAADEIEDLRAALLRKIEQFENIIKKK